MKTWSWHGPKNRHFLNISLAKSWPSYENFRTVASLEVELGQIWSLHCPNMVLVWCQIWFLRYNLYTRLTQVSKLFRILASWKEKICKHGPNMIQTWPWSVPVNWTLYIWTCSTDQVYSILKISELYLVCI